jgi:hypothetical protein
MMACLGERSGTPIRVDRLNRFHDAAVGWWRVFTVPQRRRIGPRGVSHLGSLNVLFVVADFFSLVAEEPTSGGILVGVPGRIARLHVRPYQQSRIRRRFCMHCSEPAHTDELRNPTRILAIGLSLP